MVVTAINDEPNKYMAPYLNICKYILSFQHYCFCLPLILTILRRRGVLNSSRGLDCDINNQEPNPYRTWWELGIDWTKDIKSKPDKNLEIF